MSEPVSGSPYIIICSIETEVAAAENRKKAVVAVSHGAAQLVSWMQSNNRFVLTDAQPISILQHQLMDWVKGETELSHAQVDQKIAALITEFRALEDKY